MYDVVIIGAGVVGLAVARAIGEASQKSVLIIEKEESFGRGISSRNSEVIHSGIYYTPGSLKAEYCSRGRDLLYDYCDAHNIWTNRCGKIVVGREHQSDDLEAMFHNAQENNVPEIKIIDKKEIQKLEPQVIGDVGLFVGCTGIISAHDLMASFYKKSQDCDHDYLFKSRIIGAETTNDGYELSIGNPNGEIEKVSTQWVINAAGLGSDLAAEMLTADYPSLRFSKGCYYKLSSKWRGAFDHLVYPLPDKEHGSLGIHLSFDETQMPKLGPSAHWVDDHHENYDVEESLLDQFFEEGARYIDGLKKEDLSPDFAGIRPKIWMDENPMPDFYISHEADKGFPGWVNLIGIESPGLTSAIAIGNDVARWVNEG
ncbi:MAG: NAD(P)/FAD-dependent oxidoreductase [Candidatus Marinimicrobia bacterium]|jgi:L-2-hydroxyglutarate oxidase LhgO|nr:NAD(P)/FAD-dependent oxidoreductase [Candidatus Neomarinimicrobiota bacterium]MDP6612371.1 NAD(P)/FAD-dependent oxidoreductase [Candidatus Neomarinimicrobiota bacterium]|tara:strand:- start:597 stop:1709 length:1113 start_codon:yes stop_codon:yes gene_type:complete